MVQEFWFHPCVLGWMKPRKWITSDLRTVEFSTSKLNQDKMPLADSEDISNIIQLVEIKIHDPARNIKINPGSTLLMTQNNDQHSIIQRLQCSQMKQLEVNIEISASYFGY